MSNENDSDSDTEELEEEQQTEETETMPPIETKWDAVSFVISSRYRIAVLERLYEGPATPSLISDAMDYSIAHISRALQELSEIDLIELLVSEERRKGRVYGMTDYGKDTWETIQNEQVLES